MAVDTAEKRMSALNFGLPLFWTLPEADGTVGQDDRQHLLGLYAGILAGAVVAPTQPGLEFTLPENRMHFDFPENRMHFECPENRMHFDIPEED